MSEHVSRPEDSLRLADSPAWHVKPSLDRLLSEHVGSSEGSSRQAHSQPGRSGESETSGKYMLNLGW